MTGSLINLMNSQHLLLPAVSYHERLMENDTNMYTDLLECASYVCGGYYSAFKDILKAGKHLNVGFPIGEIDYDGTIIMTKEENTGGVITVGSVTSQLLYEIQGPLYYNCDVTADLTGMKMEQLGEDRVKVTGIKGLPPPPTTKIG